jgi:hypothetical protein
MEKILQCDCGFEARADHDDGLVVEVQRHAWEAHGMALSRDQAVLLASRADLDPTESARPPFDEALDEPSQNDMSDKKEEK